MQFIRVARLARLSVFAMLLTGSSLLAQLVDFETTPAGLLPTDNGVLLSSTPYVFPGVQISFGFDSDSNGSIDADPAFELAGPAPDEPPNGGFSGSFGIDTPDPGFGAQLGNWFLRNPVPGANFGKLIITYNTALTINAASGEIWDIDGTDNQNGGFTEQYRVQAFDSASNLLGTIDSPVGTLPTPLAPLDGQPWVFAFSGLSGSIDRIEVSFIGTKPSGIGLAFNNFYPVSVPEPAGLTLIGGLALLLRRR